MEYKYESETNLTMDSIIRRYQINNVAMKNKYIRKEDFDFIKHLGASQSHLCLRYSTILYLDW